MEPEVFTEQQKFKNKMFWWILIPAMLFSYGVTVPGFFEGKTTGTLVAIIIMTVVFVPLIGGVLIGVLHTRVDAEGVHYRYAPFKRKYNTIKWTEMKKAYIKKYDAFGEYGGWGIRWGADGWLYNMQGDMGLMIKKKKGTDVLLGTQKPDELEQFVKAFAPPELTDQEA